MLAKRIQRKNLISALIALHTFVLFSLPKDEAANNQWLKLILFHFTAAVQPLSFLCSRNFTDDCFSNLEEFNTRFTKHLLLKVAQYPVYLDQPVPLNQPVYMINNRCLYFLLSVQNNELCIVTDTCCTR